MKAMVLKQYGEALAPGVFEEMELAEPQVIPGHVLINVAASSVNPLDYKIRSGMLSGLNPNLPVVLHGDVAGTITAVGEGVTQFKVGDEVYGCAGGIIGRSGAIAQTMLAEASLLAHKPKSLSLQKAAALPLVAITAWEGLVNHAQLKKGQSVLVYGGTGGVGHMAVQLAKALGSKVVTTAGSEEKMALCYELGADQVFNYKETNASDYIKQQRDENYFDVVYDSTGGDNLNQSMRAVAINGHLVTPWVQGEIDLSPLYLKGGSLHFVLMLNPMLHNQGCDQQGHILKEIATFIDAGEMKPLIDKEIFPFTRIGEAHYYAEQGKAIGKVVLVNDL